MAYGTELMFEKKNGCSCCYVLMVLSMLTVVVLFAVLPPILNCNNCDDRGLKPTISSDNQLGDHSPRPVIHTDSDVPYSLLSEGDESAPIKSSSEGDGAVPSTTSSKGNHTVPNITSPIADHHAYTTASLTADDTTLLTSLPTTVAPSDDASVVVTPSGSFKGDMLQKVLVFHGVPYARPPVEELRWRPPRSIARRPVHNVYDATAPKPGCPQNCKLGVFCPSQTSEDCLHLEIYTPATAPSSQDKLSVLFFIHGGAFDELSATGRALNATKFVERANVIVVMADYRLGALGFMYTGSSEEDSPGNLGILDQRKALEWVRENIEYFGGDPDKITLSGQSAGAQSALIHMTSSESEDYFRHIILESPPVFLPYATRQKGVLLSTALSKKVGCTTESRKINMTCMRGISPSAIVEAQEKVSSSEKFMERFETWGPVVDSSVVQYEPLESLQRYSQRKAKPVPLIWGVTSEEALIFVRWFLKTSIPSFLYPVMISRIFWGKEDHSNLRRYYPNSKGGDAREDISVLFTDFLFRCPRRFSMNTLRNDSQSNMWAFMWQRAAQSSMPAFSFCENRVCHGTELPFVFQSFSAFNGTVHQKDLDLSNAIIDYYTNFIEYGNPNGRGQNNTSVATKDEDENSSLLEWPKIKQSNGTSLPEWPKIKQSNGTFVQLYFKNDGTIAASDTATDERCDMWDARGYSIPRVNVAT